MRVGTSNLASLVPTGLEGSVEEVRAPPLHLPSGAPFRPAVDVHCPHVQQLLRQLNADVGFSSDGVARVALFRQRLANRPVQRSLINIVEVF